MPRTCLSANVASIRVNCQIYVTSVMINTFITFLLKQSTLPLSLNRHKAVLKKLTQGELQGRRKTLPYIG